MLTAAVKALHESQPGMFITDYVGHHGRLSDGNNLFEHNPYITPFYEGPPHDVRKHVAAAQYVMCDYGYGCNGAGRSFHFLYGFTEFLSRKLGVHIEMKDFKGDLYLEGEDLEPWPGLPATYAIIDAGHKADVTAKLWSVYRYQEVVNATKDRIAWVQVGSAADTHAHLTGVHDLIGQTNLRQLIRVFRGASLVLTPISLPMHLAAAVPMIGDGNKPAPADVEKMHERYGQKRGAAKGERGSPGDDPPACRKIRPCVVLAGQREQRQWELYPGHVMLGTDGKLSQCPVGVGDACWRNKTVKIDKDQSLCMSAMLDEQGKPMPECLHRVSVAEVVRAIERFL